MCFDICTINIRVSIRVRGLHLVVWLLFGIAIAVGMPSAVKASFEMVRYDDVWFLALNICITPLKVRRSMLALQLPSCFAYAVSCESYASRATAWANGDMVSMDIYGHHREVLFLVLFLVLTQALEESPDHLTMIEHTRASLGCCRSSEHAIIMVPCIVENGHFVDLLDLVTWGIHRNPKICK